MLCEIFIRILNWIGLKLYGRFRNYCFEKNASSVLLSLWIFFNLVQSEISHALPVYFESGILTQFQQMSFLCIRNVLIKNSKRLIIKCANIFTILSPNLFKVCCFKNKGFWQFNFSKQLCNVWLGKDFELINYVSCVCVQNPSVNVLFKMGDINLYLP